MVRLEKRVQIRLDFRASFGRSQNDWNKVETNVGLLCVMTFSSWNKTKSIPANDGVRERHWTELIECRTWSASAAGDVSAGEEVCSAAYRASLRTTCPCAASWACIAVTRSFAMLYHLQSEPTGDHGQYFLYCYYINNKIKRLNTSSCPRDECKGALANRFLLVMRLKLVLSAYCTLLYYHCPISWLHIFFQIWGPESKANVPIISKRLI